MTPPRETLEQTAAALEADALAVGSPRYAGRAYFWAYAFRHLLRDCSPAARRKAHRLILAEGLEPSGETPRHLALILAATLPAPYARRALRATSQAEAEEIEREAYAAFKAGRVRSWNSIAGRRGKFRAATEPA